MKNRNSLYIRVLLVVLPIVIFMAFISRTSRPAQHDAWLPSSFNPIGAGNLALYQTLEDLNWPVERWRDPLGRLAKTSTGNVMIITRSADGARVEFSDQEIELLDAWVAKGNTLILLGALDQWDDTRGLLRQIGFVLPDRNGSVRDFIGPFHRDDKHPVVLDPPAGSSSGLHLTLPFTRGLPVGVPRDAHVLWQAAGEAYIVDIPQGKGHVICGSSDELLGNKVLSQRNNLAAVLSLLAPDGRVPRHLYFEERHHGYSSNYAMADLLNSPGLRFAGMLALLGALALLGTSLVRFGPILPLHPSTGRSTLEFVDSIADLYVRADLRNETIHYLYRETHQRLLTRLHLPPSASNDLIAARLQQAHPHLPKWKKLAQRFDSPEYTEGLPPTGWLRVAKDLIQIKSAMA